MSQGQPTRSTVFISYSHEDAEELKRLQVYLKPLERAGLIERWDDTRIRAGQKWKEEIERGLRQAKVAVLLISADFLASDFIADEELPKLLKAAEDEGLIVLPVILNPCRFTRTPILRDFQAANDPATPLSELSENEQDEVWLAVTNAIEDALHPR